MARIAHLGVACRRLALRSEPAVQRVDELRELATTHPSRLFAGVVVVVSTQRFASLIRVTRHPRCLRSGSRARPPACRDGSARAPLVPTRG
jgi:hypothetical protein